MLSTRDAKTLRLQWMAARYKERVGERIKAAREARNWTQTELARAMPGSLDGASISRWETGKVEPRADNLQALADALGVDPGYFLVPEPEPGTGDLMGVLATVGGTQLDRIEAKLDLLLERVGGIDPADFTEQITKHYEALDTPPTGATAQAARGSGKRSDAKKADRPTRAPRKQRTA